MNPYRFKQNPLIFPELHPSIGTNINGPSLIRVPDWMRMYFHSPVRQMRDPGMYEEDGRTFLLYSIAGEAGIAAAEIME